MEQDEAKGCSGVYADRFQVKDFVPLTLPTQSECRRPLSLAELDLRFQGGEPEEEARRGRRRRQEEGQAQKGGARAADIRRWGRGCGGGGGACSGGGV